MEMDGAIGEGVVFLKHFHGLPDHRQAGKVVYPLDEILLLCLLAVIAGTETFSRIPWIKHGVPCDVCPTLWEVIRSHYRKLKRFGRPDSAVEFAGANAGTG